MATGTDFNRPVSRRGHGERSPTVMAESRPATAARPITAKRPPSVSQLRAPPSSAARLNTGLLPPKTGVIMNMADRPITQQGLSGLRTGTAQGQRRQVLDKRYYEGLIRQKMKIISTEVNRLNAEIETQRQHQATTDVYDARVKEVAQELTTLQAELTDYNYILDRMHTGGDVSDIVAETDEVRADNARDAAALEQLYKQNRDFEHQIHTIEVQLQNERNATQKLLDDMDPETRERYDALEEKNKELLSNIFSQQQQLEGLKNQAADLNDKISGSQIKQEAVLLYQKLREREEKKEQLEQELLSKWTPAQEREQLLQRVREDNAEMAAMERQLTQLSEQIKAQKQEIELVEQDLEESQSDRHQKLKELRQREETMEKFLTSFEESRDTETDRIQVLEGKIEVALQQMTRNLITPGALPSKNEFAIMKETLYLKQDEIEKSKMTAEELSREELKLKENVRKVEDLEEKIVKEMENLKNELQQMQSDMIFLNDLEALRNNSLLKREELTQMREDLNKKMIPTERIHELKNKHELLQKQLMDNDTYVQLHTLEKKFQLLEENNAALKDQLTTKKAELNFEGPKAQALELLLTYNKLLQTKYTNRH